MADIKVTQENFDQEVLQSKMPVLVDFWADWCGPCRMLGPIIEELEKNNQNKVKIVKANIDENSESVQKYNILSIPTVIMFHQGEPVSQIVGVQAKEKYQEEINKTLGNK